MDPTNDNEVQELPASTAINQTSDISPVDIQPMTISDRLERLEIVAGITIN